MIRVNATGCSLVDNIYGRASFHTPVYHRLMSREIGDGGLVTGGLTFSEALANFAGDRYETVLEALGGGTAPDRSNIGGPGIVPIIHAAQVCRRKDIRYRFAGVVGSDTNGRRLRELMSRTGFAMDDYIESVKPTPSTDVFSDPSFDGGRGERTFVNTIGAAGCYGPDSLPDDFFEAEFILFGATALVPPLHDALDQLCRRARNADAFVMVCTVFDFRNEARMKGLPWPLVNEYANIDLLVVDREEALKISGRNKPEAAMRWFLDAGCRGVIVTRGADDVLLGVGAEGVFRPPERCSMPTCRYADEVAASMSEARDTTGCGDNFVGGVIDAVAQQMAERSDSAESGGYAKHTTPGFDLEEAVISGIAAGSVALTCLGGVYYEKERGEKYGIMETYRNAYRAQLTGAK